MTFPTLNQSGRPYQFRWRCSYRGCVWFDVIGDGPAYEIELRRTLDDSERAIIAGGADYIARMVEPTIGAIRRSHRATHPIAPEVVAAFNAWRAEEHALQVEYMRARPERYGEESAWRETFKAPAPVRGVYLAPDLEGWIESAPAA